MAPRGERALTRRWRRGEASGGEDAIAMLRAQDINLVLLDVLMPEMDGFQVLEQMDSWEEEMDQLLMSLALVGTEFKKSYYDPVERKNVSELVFAKDLVVNYWAASLEKARRVTHVISLYENEIVERVRSGVYADFDFDKASPESKDEDAEGEEPCEDSPYTFLEQHRWWDLLSRL